MQRRRFDIFSMSFLDTICCAFGAIVLLYMILNAASGRATQHQSAASRAEADRLETQVLDGYENLVVLTNALKSTTVSPSVMRTTICRARRSTARMRACSSSKSNGLVT